MRWSKSLIAAGMLVAVMGATADAGVNPLSLYAGAGYAKETNTGAPGGSVGFVAGATVDAVVVRMGAEVGYDLLGSATVNTTKSTLSLIPVTAQLYYGLPLPEGTVKPWLTVGAGPYSQRVKVEPSGLPSTTINSSKLGFNLGAGVDRAPPATGWKFGLDGRFHVIGKDSKIGSTESTKVLTLMVRLYLM